MRAGLGEELLMPPCHVFSLCVAGWPLRSQTNSATFPNEKRLELRLEILGAGSEQVVVTAAILD